MMVPSKRRFWLVALGFGALMALLYAIEVGRLAAIVFFHEGARGTVLERHDSPGASFLFYKYKVREKELFGTKIYRFPEKLFISGLGEGETFDTLVFSAYPDWSTPRPFILTEVMLSLNWLALAFAVAIKARRELRKPLEERR